MTPIAFLASVALLSLLPSAPNGPSQTPLWQLTQNTVPDAIYGMHFRDARNGHAVGWAFNTPDAVVLSTADAGRTWTLVRVQTDAILFAVAFTDADHGYAVGQDSTLSKGLLLRTDDGGATWTERTFGQTFGLYDVSFPTPSTGYLCGWDGAIYKTTDAGSNWTKLATGLTTTTFRNMSFVDETRGFALGGPPFTASNAVYATSDGGASWVRTKKFGAAHYHADIYFQSATRGFIAGHRNGTERVLRTEDGGVNWSTVSQGPDNQVLQAIHGHGQRICAVGVTSNVHYSDDGGTTWSLVPAPVNAGWQLAVAVTEAGVYSGGSDGEIYRWAVEPTTYCTAKVNSQGCTPSIGWTGGNASASQPSGFQIVSSDTLAGRAGLFFYGYASKATPYQGGYRCVEGPVRTPLQSSGGTPPCGGAFSYDFNARIASGVDPALTAGTTVYGQYWSRDPAAAFHTNSSDAIEFVICP